MEKISLTIKQKELLEFINLFYDRRQNGCRSIATIKNANALRELEEMDLIFKTSEGWFPSTKGQNYVNNGYR